MSVQAGVWNFDGRPVDRKLIEDLGDSVKLQGPDDESHFVSGPIGLLYRPFHTTAESRREKQPYLSRRGFVLTWDGRLDNRDVLIAQLGIDLMQRRDDLAIVAAAFDRWESEAFRRLVGDWAVTIWKPQTREIVFAIDYMAVRHIFYYLKPNRVLWSTDLSSIVLLSGDRFQLDDDYVAGFLAHDSDAHLTPYREIREVPPGQFVRIHDGQVATKRYWQFSPSSRIRYKTDTEYEEHFRHLFRQSVRRRLRSDSVVLAELSGGLDSSSIVCMADDVLSKEGAETPRLDTISFYDNTEPNGDDSIYFQKVEVKRGRVGIHIDSGKMGCAPPSLELPEFSAMPGDLRFGQHLGEERAERVLDGGYRVVLSGIGGDEFLGGVPDPRALLADLIVQGKFVTLAKQLTAWSLIKRRPWIRLLWQSAIELLPTALGQYCVQEAEIESWIRKDFAERTRLAIKQVDVDDHCGMWLPSRRGYIGGVVLMASQLAKFTPPSSAMEEARYPYLDQNLIEFTLSIPATQLLRPGERRSLMRRSLAGIVPDEILSRRTKQVGARGPVMMLEKYWDELQSIYQHSLSSRFGYVDDAQVLKTICEARAGKIVSLVRLFWTISLEYWLRDLVARGLLNAPGSLPSPMRTHAVPVSA